MQMRTKSIIALIITLLIGIVLGAVGSGMLRNSVIRNRMSEFRSPQHFQRSIERVIAPTSDQRAQVRIILDRQQQSVMELSQNFHLEMDSLNHRFRKELSAVLRPDQMDRLRKFMERGPRPPRTGRGEGRFREYRRP